MKLIDRYISKNILYPTLSIIAILSSIILITQSLKYIDLMVSHGISSLDFLYISILLLPSLLFIIIPICLFIAIIYSLNKLVAHRELNILKGIGMNNFAIAKPVLRISLFIALLHCFISLYWMPIVNHHFKELTKDLKENYITFFLQEKVFNHPTNDLTFYISNKINNSKFEHVFYQDTSKESPITIIAEKGNLIKKDNKMFLNLKKGNRQERNLKGELTILYFDTLLVELNFNKTLGSERNLAIQEKSFFSLLFPAQDTDSKIRLRLLSEASHRLTWPFYNLILTMIAITALFHGEYDRSGKTKRIIFFACTGGIIVIINNSLINLSSSYIVAMIFSYLFTFGLAGALVHNLFYRKEYL